MVLLSTSFEESSTSIVSRCRAERKAMAYGLLASNVLRLGQYRGHKYYGNMELEGAVGGDGGAMSGRESDFKGVGETNDAVEASSISP